MQTAEMMGLKLRNCARPDGKLHKSIVTHPLVQLLGLSSAIPTWASVRGVFVSLQGLGVRLPRGFTHLDWPVQCLPRAVLAPCRALRAMSQNFGDSLLRGLAGRAWTHFPGELCRSALPWPFSSRPIFEPSASSAVDHGWGSSFIKSSSSCFFCPQRHPLQCLLFPSWVSGQARAHTHGQHSWAQSLSLLNTSALRAWFHCRVATERWGSCKAWRQWWPRPVPCLSSVCPSPCRMCLWGIGFSDGLRVTECIFTWHWNMLFAVEGLDSHFPLFLMIQDALYGYQFADLGCTVKMLQGVCLAANMHCCGLWFTANQMFRYTRWKFLRLSLPGFSFPTNKPFLICFEFLSWMYTIYMCIYIYMNK